MSTRITADTLRETVANALRADGSAQAAAVLTGIEDGTYTLTERGPLTERASEHESRGDDPRIDALRTSLSEALEAAMAHAEEHSPRGGQGDEWATLLELLQRDGVAALFGLGGFVDRASWQMTDEEARDHVTAGYADVQTFPAGDGSDRLITLLREEGLVFAINDAILYPFGLGLAATLPGQHPAYLRIVQTRDPAGLEWTGEHDREVGIGKIRDRALATLRARLIEFEQRISQEANVRTGFLASGRTHRQITDAVLHFLRGTAPRATADGGYRGVTFDTIMMQVGITRSQLSAALQALIGEGTIAEHQGTYIATKED